jgi:putative ABC transport system permease protein
LTSVDPGFETANVLTFQVAMPQRPTPELARMSEELVRRLRTEPGIEAAAYARQLPMVQLSEGASFRRSPAVPAQPRPPGADARLVGGSYFETLGIRIVAGRGLTDRDGAGRPRAVVINETLAHRDFAGENPIGQEVYIGRDSLPWEIVGIAGDVRQFGPSKPPDPQFFADARQWPVPNEVFIGFLGPYYAIRARANAAATATAIERIVREIQPGASLHNVATLEALVANVVARPRLYTVLLGLFAAIAVTLAAIGVYGLVAYAVGERTHEIGIRMALGASRGQVLRLVVRQMTSVSTLGIVAGMAGAAALTRYLEGMLFGVTPLDTPTFAVVALVFGILTAVAAYVPARRAARMTPLLALRAE